MISENLVFVQLAQQDDYICIVELASSLEASVSEVRQRLIDLGDRVEHNEHDQWRVVRQIISNNLLSEAEKKERDSLERTVQQAFCIAGKALKLLRDKRLYRETHSSFEYYVRDRFDFTRRAADYLISAAEVVDNLKREQIVLETNVLPTKESQCRSLAKLSPKEQQMAWSRAVEKAGGKVPSSRVVNEAVREIKELALPEVSPGTCDDRSVDCSTEAGQKIEPSFREVNYTAGVGVEYMVRLDEETYNRLQTYQDKIGSATKNGAIVRLLDAIAEYK